jgi:hypothetical protein
MKTHAFPGRWYTHWGVFQIYDGLGGRHWAPWWMAAGLRLGLLGLVTAQFEFPIKRLGSDWCGCSEWYTDGIGELHGGRTHGLPSYLVTSRLNRGYYFSSIAKCTRTRARFQFWEIWTWPNWSPLDSKSNPIWGFHLIMKASQHCVFFMTL